jgi:hypothetical protein
MFVRASDAFSFSAPFVLQRFGSESTSGVVFLIIIIVVVAVTVIVITMYSV